MIPVLVGSGSTNSAWPPAPSPPLRPIWQGCEWPTCRDLARDAIAATTVAQVRERLRAASLGTVAPV